MGVPRQVEASAQRAADLQKRLAGDPAQAAAPKANPSEHNDRSDQASRTEKQAPPVSEDARAPDAAGQVHDWQKRFTNLNQTHQVVKSELTRLQAEAARREAELTERLARLEEQARTAQQAGPVVDRSYLSEDDMALLGEEQLAVVEKVAGRMAERYVAGIEERRKREEELRRAKEAQQRAEKEKADTFKDRLARAVTNFSQIDTDPKFIQWMQGPDPLTGETRIELLRRSTVIDDVGRAASFYNEYAAQQRGQPDLREQMVEPKPAAPRPPPRTRPPGQIWTGERIKQFYEEVRRGRITNPQKIRATEEDILAARLDGRYRP